MLFAILLQTSVATPVNSPKIEKILQTLAATQTPQKFNDYERLGAHVEYHRVVVDIVPIKGADITTTVNSFTANDWSKFFCSADIYKGMKQLDFEIEVRLRAAGKDYSSVVNQTRCLSRTIPASDGSTTVNGIVFGPKPTAQEASERITAFLRATLKDPYSAKVSCSNPSERAWTKEILSPKKYGYFVQCEINAKNSYGAYVGSETWYFRFNGAEFERIENPNKAGLM